MDGTMVDEQPDIPVDPPSLLQAWTGVLENLPDAVFIVFDFFRHTDEHGKPLNRTCSARGLQTHGEPHEPELSWTAL